MVDLSQYWPVVLCSGLGVFLMRFVFILILDKVELPAPMLRMLRFIPAAVLTAIVVPSVLLQKNGGIHWAQPERMIAALLAVLVAWKTRNVLATIGSGMLALWLLQYVFTG